MLGQTSTTVTGPETTKRTGGPSTDEAEEGDASNKRSRLGDGAENTDACCPPGSITDSTSGEKETKNEEMAVVAKADSGGIKAASAAAVRTARLMEEDLQYDSGFTTFPEKLMTLLDSEEVKDKMWWLPDGDGFAFKPDNFAETVLAQHFGGTRLESFTRKLNRWGFKRVAGQMVPLNSFAYYHRSFLRGKPELVKEMSGSKNKQANATRGHKVQQQAQLGAAREDGEAATQGFPLQAFTQPHLGQQVRGMTGGEMFFPGIGTPGADPRLEFYLMQQRNQQERLNELAREQQRLASLDPDMQMRMLHGGSAYHGFPPGMNANLVGQQLSFGQRFDPSNNATAAASMNDRMMTMRHASSQQQNIGSAPGPWMQMQQQQLQQEGQHQPPIIDSSLTNQLSPHAEIYESGQSNVPNSAVGN